MAKTIQTRTVAGLQMCVCKNNIRTKEIPEIFFFNEVKLRKKKVHRKFMWAVNQVRKILFLFLTESSIKA